jgi:hypothetical protein
MSRYVKKLNVNANKPRYYDLFISYHPEQRLEVERICRILRSYNLRIWYDQDCLQSHLNKFDETFQALRDSFIFLCLTSTNYSRNVRCRTEFSIAVEQKMDIVDLRVENFEFDQTQHLKQV